MNNLYDEKSVANGPLATSDPPGFAATYADPKRGFSACPRWFYRTPFWKSLPGPHRAVIDELYRRISRFNQPHYHYPINVIRGTEAIAIIQLARKSGVTAKQARVAIDNAVEAGVIRKRLRTIPMPTHNEQVNLFTWLDFDAYDWLESTPESKGKSKSTPKPKKKSEKGKSELHGNPLKTGTSSDADMRVGKSKGKSKGKINTLLNTREEIHTHTTGEIGVCENAGAGKIAQVVNGKSADLPQTRAKVIDWLIRNGREDAAQLVDQHGADLIMRVAKVYDDGLQAGQWANPAAILATFLANPKVVITKNRGAPLDKDRPQTDMEIRRGLFGNAA